MERAITHTDGTARLQTFTRVQNELMFSDPPPEFERQACHGIISNMSFHVKGKPIRTRLSGTVEIRDKSERDAIYYTRNVISKRKHPRQSKRSPVFTWRKAARVVDRSDCVVQSSADCQEATAAHQAARKDLTASRSQD
jgi:hypothetical protein